jgi:hypothetical protein
MSVGEQRAGESTPRRSTTLRTAYISCFGWKRGDLGQARHRYLPKPRAEAIEPAVPIEKSVFLSFHTLTDIQC